LWSGRWFGTERTAALTFICSDMWKPYLKIVAKKAADALHILDRFHIAKHMSDAIDQVRRAMLLREWFDDFWHYRSVDWAGAFLDEWCVQVMRSRIEPMKKVARMLRRHRPLILNWY
jgi:transposase